MSGPSSTTALNFDGEEVEEEEEEEAGNNDVVVLDVEEIKLRLFNQCNNIETAAEMKTFAEKLSVGLQAHNRGCTLVRIQKWFISIFSEAEYTLRSKGVSNFSPTNMKIFWDKFNIITAEQLPGLGEAIIEGFRPT